MAEIRWTDEAERWLREIHDYIAEDNPEAAHKVVLGIYERTQILRRFPEVGYVYHIEGDPIIRVPLYGNYRIAYLVYSPDAIDILGVFHGAMDITRYLR